MNRHLSEPPLFITTGSYRLNPFLYGPWVAGSINRNIPELPKIVHCRGPWAAAMGLSLRKRHPTIKVIFDCRGVRVEENKLSGASASQIKRAADIEQRVARDCDAICCVTAKLGDYLVDRYQADSGKITVTPAGFDESRFYFDKKVRQERRRDMGIDDRRPVFIFCGGWDPWQAVPLNARLMKQLLKINKDALILGLSQNAAKIDRVFAEQGIPSANRLVLTVPFETVSSYLCAADGAVVLRESSIINQVASPVKFAEYQACGLPVAVSEGLGDAAEYVQATGSGQVYRGDLLTVAQELTKLADQDRSDPSRREKRSRTAASKLSLGANIDLLAQLYQSLLQSN